MPGPDTAYWRFRLRSALRWYAAARTRYDVHSPFLSDFLREVYHDDREYHAFGVIRKLRRSWRGRRMRVELRELGAPSKTTSKSSRTASSLVADNAIDDASGRLLFRLVVWLRPRQILEFGTNAGISTAYLHLADTRATLRTVEGNPEVAALARETFAEGKFGSTLKPYVALFSDWLDEHFPDLPAQDLIFIDGDHRYQPTLDYVSRLLERAHERTVFVIADIHWSEGMERAWAELKELPRVTASVDTYHFGLLFLRPELNGPHVSLISTKFKPWRVGFF